MASPQRPATSARTGDAESGLRPTECFTAPPPFAVVVLRSVGSSSSLQAARTL